MWGIFDTLNLSGLSYSGACVAIRDKAGELLTVWETKDYGSSPIAGEVSRGVVDVFYSSADYWKGNPVNIPAPTYGLGAAVVGLDAAGYIAGWTKAVVDEINDKEYLSPANENKRIQAGLAAAAAASFLRIVTLRQTLGF